MSHSLNSLRGVIRGIILGTTIGDIKRETRSLDYAPYSLIWVVVEIMVRFWVP